MREVQVTCPQCGQSDAYVEHEKGDFTNPYTIFLQQPWKCRSCGYPEVNWNNWARIWIPQKVTVNFKITDADGNVIKEWNE